MGNKESILEESNIADHPTTETAVQESFLLSRSEDNLNILFKRCRETKLSSSDSKKLLSELNELIKLYKSTAYGGSSNSKTKIVLIIMRLSLTPNILKKSLSNNLPLLFQNILSSEMSELSCLLMALLGGLLNCQEDSFRVSICSQMEKLGYYVNMCELLRTLHDSKQDDPAILFSVVLILDHFNWILMKHSAFLLSAPLQQRIRLLLAQSTNISTLFKYINYSCDHISCSAVEIIYSILISTDKPSCAVLQVGTIYRKLKTAAIIILIHICIHPIIFYIPFMSR